MNWLIGYGDIAQRVAHRLVARSLSVSTLSRGGNAVRPHAVQHYIADLDQPDTLPTISGRVVYCAPPPSSGDRDTRMMHFLPQIRGCEVIVYLSTSGVYGDCDGHWVDETASPDPKSMRSIRRYDAECQLKEWSSRHDVRIAILRVPGIYAIDRLPRARLERGDPILDPQESGWSNRIHAEDLADAIVQALENGAGVYNVSDGNPSSMSEFFLSCARHLGLPAPPTLSRSQAKQVFSPQLWSYMEESSRLNIDKARRELQFHPRFPTLEAAFSKC